MSTPAPPSTAADPAVSSKQPTQPPVYKFTITDPSTAAAFNVPSSSLIAARKAADPTVVFTGLGTGAVVFNRARTAVLLVQRSASDSMPGLWEVPGGGVDDEDATVAHAVARELWEEAGLVARRVGAVVPTGEGGPLEYVFLTRSRKIVAKFHFIVDADCDEDAVRLDPKEHQAFVWATEEECEAEQTKGGMEIPFTRNEQKMSVLQAWRMVREGRDGLDGEQRVC